MSSLSAWVTSACGGKALLSLLGPEGRRHDSDTALSQLGSEQGTPRQRSSDQGEGSPQLLWEWERLHGAGDVHLGREG